MCGVHKLKPVTLLLHTLVSQTYIYICCKVVSLGKAQPISIPLC